MKINWKSKKVKIPASGILLIIVLGALPTMKPLFYGLLILVIAAMPFALKVNYFRRHWRGELSLPVSFWISYLAVTVFVSNLLLSPLMFLALPFYICLAVGINLWGAVGLWRSALVYRTKNPKKYWGGTARFFILCCSLLLGFCLFGLVHFISTISYKLPQYY